MTRAGAFPHMPHFAMSSSAEAPINPQYSNRRGHQIRSKQHGRLGTCGNGHHQIGAAQLRHHPNLSEKRSVFERRRRFSASRRAGQTDFPKQVLCKMPLSRRGLCDFCTFGNSSTCRGSSFTPCALGNSGDYSPRVRSVAPPTEVSPHRTSPGAVGQSETPDRHSRILSGTTPPLVVR